MRSVVGPLLFALLMFNMAGCALPARSRDRAESLGFPVDRSPRSARITSDSSTDEGLSFKAPARTRDDVREDSADERGDRPAKSREIARNSANPDADSTQFQPGHSSDNPHEAIGADSSHDERMNPWDSEQNKKTFGEKAELDTVSADESLADRSSLDEGVLQVGNRSRGDANRWQIQQQKFDAEQSDIGSRGGTAESAGGNSSPGDPTKTGSRSNKSTVASSSQKTGTPKAGNVVSHASDRPVTSPNVHSGKKSTPTVRQTSQTESQGTNPILGSSPNPSVVPWQNELEQLIARVETELGQSKSDSAGTDQDDELKKQVHLRLLYLVAQRQEEAISAIPDVPSSQQEYWQQMVWAMSNSLDTTQFPDPDQRAIHTVGPLAAALRQVREQAGLSIKNMAFCRKISYFGNYERFPRNDFTAGHEVLLYTEIENFVSAPTGDGEYRTSLKSLIEIADSQGRTVWTKGFPSTEDFCRNPRRDYFHNYQFYIPEDLSTGAYTLKLTIVDELGKKKGTNSLNFVLK